MAEIKLRRRYKLAGDVHTELLKAGWPLEKATEFVENIPDANVVEVHCHCCDCYYLLNGKNSFGLYFFCGHQNGLKNIRNTANDFCIYAKKRDGGVNG